jgi:hypothetical protein
MSTRVRSEGRYLGTPAPASCNLFAQLSACIFGFGQLQVNFSNLRVFFMFSHYPIERRAAAFLFQISEITFSVHRPSHLCYFSTESDMDAGVDEFRLKVTLLCSIKGLHSSAKWMKGFDQILLFFGFPVSVEHIYMCTIAHG